ncbi:hypothetical protein M3Y99_00473200 [Aphelenchoides fujianensis]|nr:hypothetical protein M3Y99_00473200 [Aphelenchoides fujianensis]
MFGEAAPGMSTLYEETESMIDELDFWDVHDAHDSPSQKPPSFMRNLNRRRKFCTYLQNCRRAQCDFAHSEAELNTSPLYNKVCPRLETCEYGACCHFIHPDEPTQKPYKPTNAINHLAPTSTKRPQVSKKSNLEMVQKATHNTRALQTLPPPQTSDFEIPRAAVELNNGENFVLFDSRDDPTVVSQLKGGRFIMFGAKETIAELHAEQWAFDSMEHHVPKHFHSLTSVFGLPDDGVEVKGRPAVVIISTLPLAAFFKFALEKLCEKLPNVRPSTIFVEFDRSVIAECGRRFRGGLKIVGCFAHFARRLHEEIEKNDHAYSQLLIDQEFESSCRRLALLALVPPSKLRAAFDLLKADVQKKYGRMLDPVFEWLERTYIGNGSVPEISPAFWNVSGRVDADLKRCSNLLLAWDAQLGRRIVAQHPPIWSWILEMKNEMILPSATHVPSGSWESAADMFEQLSKLAKKETPKVAEGNVQVAEFLERLAPHFRFVN